MLSGAVAGMGALEVNSSSDEEDEGDEERAGGRTKKGRAPAASSGSAAAAEDDDAAAAVTSVGAACRWPCFFGARFPLTIPIGNFQSAAFFRFFLFSASRTGLLAIAIVSVTGVFAMEAGVFLDFFLLDAVKEGALG